MGGRIMQLGTVIVGQATSGRKQLHWVSVDGNTQWMKGELYLRLGRY